MHFHSFCMCMCACVCVCVFTDAQLLLVLQYYRCAALIYMSKSKPYTLRSSHFRLCCSSIPLHISTVHEMGENVSVLFAVNMHMHCQLPLTCITSESTAAAINATPNQERHSTLTNIIYIFFSVFFLLGTQHH